MTIRFAVAFFLLALVGCGDEPTTTTGYVEGEYLYFAPSTTGPLTERPVRRGDDVKKGDLLFSLDLTSLTARLRANEALAVREKAVRDTARKELARAKALVKTGAISRSDYDARLKDAESAEASLRAAREALAEDAQKLREASPKAPSDGRIEDVYFNIGELVSQGTPVLSFLPRENVKLRFYISQRVAAWVKVGDKIHFSGDGSKEKRVATIRFIASEAEYTPPVIYSVGSRDKLVFRVEAYPDDLASGLHPGLPVDIDFAAP